MLQSSRRWMSAIAVKQNGTMRHVRTLRPKISKRCMNIEPKTSKSGALSHIRVLDLSRVLAGPWATQYLADMGADVIKVELPKVGDDTRAWGPPFLDNTKESAYYLGANRGKRSITVDMAKEEGQNLLRKLVLSCDVVVENFKVGGLRKYRLDYESLRAIKPDIVYASISGFGQDGPRAPQAGYDFAIQAMGGLMSITGEKEGPPLKVGVAVTDIMTGMYTVSGILTALIHREKTGIGQHIDSSLFDTQLAYLANQGMNYLIGGKSPSKIGNQHPNIVPYSTFNTKDGFIVVTVGNDNQFRQLCQVLGLTSLPENSKFSTNAQRVSNRVELYNLLGVEFAREGRSHWISLLGGTSIPHSPVNSIGEAFNDPQAKYRGAVVTLEHPINGEVKTVANPLRFSESRVCYDRAPPNLGEHTEEVLSQYCGVSKQEITDLKRRGIL